MIKRGKSGHRIRHGQAENPELVAMIGLGSKPHRLQHIITQI